MKKHTTLKKGGPKDRESKKKGNACRNGPFDLG